MITVLKEIKQLLEGISSELKKPTAVTVDSKKYSHTSVFYILTDKKIPPSKYDKGWSNLFPEPKKGMLLWSYVKHFNSSSKLTIESDVNLLADFDDIG